MGRTEAGCAVVIFSTYDERVQQEYDAESSRAGQALANIIASGQNVPDYMRYGVPNCMFWPVPDTVVMAEPLTHDKFDSPRLRAWSKDRGCAICGADKPLVRDHCHTTGLVRGYICRNCNTDEGTGNWAPWFIRWRYGWNPGVLLGIDDEYYDITGKLAINEQGRRLRMSREERQIHDAEVKAQFAALSRALSDRRASRRSIS